jgi:hypothetical protein
MNTPEVTVIAWVNGNAPDIVATVNAGPSTAALKSNLSSPITCALQITAWVSKTALNLNTSTDSAYANAWLLQNSANPAPPASITPSVRQSAGNFRLFNDFGNGGGFFQVGNTPDPCGTSIVPAGWTTGQASPYMGASATSPTGEIYQLAEGRVGTIGQLASGTINGGQTVPWIWSVIEFNPSNQSVNLTSFPPVSNNFQIFPTYSVYVNGSLVGTSIQSTVKSFVQLNASSQLTPSQIQ